MTLKKTSFFTAKIFPILLVNFIGILGYSIVIPILIFIVIDLGGNGFIYGILGAMYPFFQFIGAPLLGRLSDKIGRKKVLVISQGGTFIAWLLFLLAFIIPKTTLWEHSSELTGDYLMTLPLAVIFIARIVDGFTGGNVSVANAYLSDISTDEDRNKNFGRMGASTSLGFVLGPAVAGILASTILGEVLPLILAAVISLIAIVVIKYQLKESNPCAVDTGKLKYQSFRRIFQVEHKNCYEEGSSEYANTQGKSFKSILKISKIPLFYSVYFLTFLAFSLFYAGLPIYANTILEWNATQLGVFLAFSSIVMIIVQGPVLSRISNSFRNETLILVGSLLLAAGFIGLSFNSMLIIYIANALFSIGNGLMWPSFMALLSKTGSKSLQGTIQGYGNSMGSIASMIGLIMGGLLFEVIGTMVFTMGGAVFLIVSGLMISYWFKGRSANQISETVV